MVDKPNKVWVGNMTYLQTYAQHEPQDRILGQRTSRTLLRNNQEANDTRRQAADIATNAARNICLRRNLL
jgi:hypothetical protein